MPRMPRIRDANGRGEELRHLSGRLHLFGGFLSCLLLLPLLVAPPILRIGNFIACAFGVVPKDIEGALAELTESLATGYHKRA